MPLSTSLPLLVAANIPPLGDVPLRLNPYAVIYRARRTKDNVWALSHRAPQKAQHGGRVWELAEKRVDEDPVTS